MATTTKTIDIQDANLEELLALVREGTEIILAEGNTPLARLIPVKKRILGLHAHLGKAWTSDDFDEPLPDEFWLGEE
jgi:antitoxin (DNA-binding transcriptional repressor) of toxin-antitoxin stability system